ncbi:DUF4258 domain-containing protein [Gloeobacter morelensis]|uniref:DUF4258 domain-containing protein n=1 Tax=Gloeobacter morelensis MG652769 TaxID=2781736 RepID=A0ABY3PJ52_9CYAN|nr:DUF4258 domain-containing protein [Gloeobacter morelensis]UFP93582.1 DUF4258 domain-containing protein [Gloeobacter morelensis MG652769]
MDLQQIWLKLERREYLLSSHADRARQEDNLTVKQIKQALLDGTILEQYPDTGRGESCLLVGFAGSTPIHAVCGCRGDQLVIITVYIPKPPKFIDPWTRARGDEL